ncbi:ABC transporter substrate-binding protein [Bacillus sp. S/N-304-OC-R1]|uniref:ABC transporter substrate-binding protein n=1 Tax=Bacillus sp. S/N-304-OC-R1 TaxID=2758034 RepID=UPI001C8D7395|nr:ABC transporter substrate-binding protein [Bacillus sp. S/N-304-OC-R1]MBY0121131.1 ABC transporter substrate-binding protein [Bacillus sp. S/N-304-OC-R1]
MKKVNLAFFAVILVLSIFLSACSNDNKASTNDKEKGEAGSGGTVTFGLPGDIVSLDPAFSYDFTTNPVVTQITEGLLKFDENGHLQPLLAESWENPDPHTYIYKLRQDVKFSDGTPMTVDDVIFSMERVKEPSTASYVGWMYANVDKIEKVDDWTIKVTLSQPDTLWRYVPATTGGHVISKAYYEEHKNNFGKPDGGVMGTGPFKYVSWQTGSEIALAKNENYWDKTGGPYLNQVVFKVLPEGTTRVTGLKTNQITATIGLPLDLIPVVQGMENVKIDMVDSFLSDFIAMNVEVEPFNDVNVRKALNYALDKKKIMDEIVKEAGSPAKAVPIGPSQWLFAEDKWEKAYNELPDYTYDLAKAKEYMAKSSVPNGFNATILTDSDTLRLNSALALQAAAKELGINLEIEKVTNEELNTRAFGGARDYDILMIVWGSDFPDPVGNLQPVFHSNNRGDGGSNFANYSNPTVDKYLDEQAVLTDDERRTELMIEAEKIIAEDTPWIMIDHPKQIMASNKDLEGYNISSFWYWDAFTKNMKLK